MAHAQKPDFVFRRIGRVHLNRRGRQFSRLLAAEVCASAFIVGGNAGYTILRGSVKSTGYPLHLPFSPSFPLCASLCAITFQLESTNSRPVDLPIAGTFPHSARHAHLPLYHLVFCGLYLPCYTPFAIFPFVPLLCVTVCHHISSRVYQ